MKTYFILVIITIFNLSSADYLSALTNCQNIKKDSLKSNEPKVDIKVNKKQKKVRRTVGDNVPLRKRGQGPGRGVEG